MRHMFLVVACIFVLTACGVESFPDSPATDAGVTNVSTAFMSGHFAQSENVYEEGQFEETYSNSNGASISFATPTNDRAVMAILHLTYGGLTHRDLGVGQTHTLARYASTPNGLQAMMIGCEGERVGQWDYDSPAREVVLSVTSPEAGVRRINYTATWAPYFVTSTEPDVLSGYFDLTN